MSSLARKYFMAVSGLGLVGFVILHLAGNVLLFFSRTDPYLTPTPRNLKAWVY